ncbi:MAG: acetolactate decarboxylase [Methanoregulaceae archaeon]|jgi:acetolactate decarboxylase|nr:acetolactate decarboxylase [Methanoregulaceae archaeon]
MIGLVIILVLAALFFSELLTGGVSTADDGDTLYQVSTIDALQQGVFDGIQPVGEIKEHGDFGIGTFNALEGEMIFLDGIVYQAKSDGSVVVVPDSFTTPYTTVTYFLPDFSNTTTTPMNFSAFSTVMASDLPTENMVYAVRMHGAFPFLKVRSVPAQQKPYPTLSEAVENQSVFEYTDTTGWVVGTFTPAFFEGINIEGYHLHFISDDRQKGGHILDFSLPSGAVIEYDITPEYTLVLPTSGDFTTVDLSQDMSGQLVGVEH